MNNSLCASSFEGSIQKRITRWRELEKQPFEHVYRKKMIQTLEGLSLLNDALGVQMVPFLDFKGTRVSLERHEALS